MNKTMRNGLALLLGAVLLLSALPLAVTASGSGSKELYNWTASSLEKDKKALITNLVSSDNVQTRWNESGVMYTEQGKEQVVLHNLLNKVGGYGSKTYGLPQGQTLTMDAYPVIRTEDMGAIGLSLVCAYKTSGTAANPANNDLLRVYVSKNGMDWLDDYVTMRAASIVGSGTCASDEQVIYYELYCEDLLEINGLNAGDYIRGIRIMPDGVDGIPSGEFSLCELSVVGYESKAGFESAVPAKSFSKQEFVAVDKEQLRKDIVDAAAKSKAGSELGVIMDAYAEITNAKPGTVLDLLTIDGIQLAGGMTDKATDGVKKIFTYMYERYLLDEAKGAELLAEYETVPTTQYLLRELNTPQQVMRAYGKAEAGDILMQVTEDASHAYLVVESNPVYLADGVNVDPYQSTLTYQTLGGERTQIFYDMYLTECFAPMTATVLATGVAPVAQVETQTSFAEGVHVAVVSSLSMRDCQIAIGNTVVGVDDINATAMVCSDEKLADAVAALANGKHKMTVTVGCGVGGENVTEIEFQVKDGKATVLGTAASDHKDVCPAKAMTDVDKNAWYHEAVDYALTNGIMGGYNATTFGPNDTLSRAMVVQVLYNKEGQPAVSGKHTFADVPADQWYNNAVTWGTSNGVMGGYNATTFGPEDKVTVEQIAVILWNYSGKPAFTGSADSVGTHSDWAANALSWAVENDILEGVPYENVTGAATRAQTAQMLMNYLKNN